MVVAFWFLLFLMLRVFGFVLWIFGTVLSKPVLRGRVGSPMVILDAVSSGAEVVTFCVFIAVYSIAPIFLRDGSDTISTIKIWRRGIACSCPRIQHSVPLATLFIRRLG